MWKRKTIILITLITLLITLTACNKTMLDTNYTFDKAIIQKGDKEIIVDIESWKDYDDGEQLQLELTDGSVILVSSYNTILVCTKDGKSKVFD